MIALLLSQVLFAAQPSVPASGLDGFYQRPCFVVDTDALTTELTVEKNQWKVQNIAYEDEKCEQAYLIYEVNYKVASPADKAIDMTTTEVSYMTLSDEVSRALNMVHYCGFEDWKTKIKKVVTGKLCDEFQAPANGDVLYSIYNLNKRADGKTEFYMGTASGTADGKSAKTRHDQVDSLPFFKIR